MTKRVSIFILLVIVLLGVVAVKARRAPMRQQVQYADGTIGWYAENAIAQGLNKADVPFSERYYYPISLNVALSESSILHAQLIDRYTYGEPSQSTMVTWYRFRVIEMLSRKSLSQPFNMTPPSSLPGLAADELYIPRYDGTKVVDGIPVEFFETSFMGLEPNHEYLLFLNIYNVSNVGMVGNILSGPSAIFKIDGSGVLTPTLANLSSPFSDGLASQFGNSLSQLRAALISNPPPPPPEPCTSLGADVTACTRNGSTWNYDTCQCENGNGPARTQRR